MRALLVVIFSIVAVLWTTSPGPAHACSCIPLKAPLDALADADEVYTGTVQSIVADGGDVIVTLQVIDTWKGASGATTQLFTAQSPVSCGYAFTVDESYLVYAHARSGGGFETGICLRTRLLSEAGSDISALGPPLP